jgi:hypothetical protein
MDDEVISGSDIEVLPHDESDGADDILTRVKPRMFAVAPLERRCTAKRVAGGRCTNYAMHGSTICFGHGGKNPTTRDAIMRRMETMREPATVVISEAMHAEKVALDKHGEVVVMGPDHAMRMKAAESVLDRTGIAAQKDVNIDVSMHFAAIVAELDDASAR